MAKTESTAVNDLIKIAATRTPLRQDPCEDLMFAIPPKKERSSKHAMSRRGVEVSPLPRDRAPHGTQQHAIAMPAITIPPLPATPVPTARLSDPSVEPVATRATRPSLPPPTRSPLPPPSRSVMPSEYPIVSAVHSQPMAPALQPLIEVSVPWAEDSLDVEPFHGDSTAQVAKHRTNLEWMIKLLPVAGLMIVLGVFVGGYLVFDGQGGTQRTAAAPEGTVEVKVVGEEAEPVAVAAMAADPASEPAAVTPPNLADTTTPPPVAATTIAAPSSPAPTTNAATASAAAAPAMTTTAPNVATQATNAPTPPVAAASALAPAIATTPTSTTPPAAAAPAPAISTTVTARQPAAAAPAPAIAITATPSNTTSVRSAPAFAHRPVLVDVRIDSKPSGATVMLVDRGKQTFLGTTPISTAVDPSRTYEVLFTHKRRKPQTEPLDPKATTRLAVELGKPGNRAKHELAKPGVVTPAAIAKIEPAAVKAVAVKAPAAKVAAAAKPVAIKAPVAKVAKPAKIIEPSWDTDIGKAAKTDPKKIETREPAKAETVEKAEKAVGGNGVLMISSKPPCEIHIDGKSTGLMTPQRALPLAAGKHKITLVNPAQEIKKSIAVEITANESTKVIQDLTELMK